MNPSRRQRLFLIVFPGLITVVFGLLTWRLVHLQFTLKDRFTESSERQRHAEIGSQPRRGLILDARGRILAASVKTYNVFAEPRCLLEDVEKLKTTALELQKMLNEPGYELCARIDTSRNPGYVKLKQDIGFEEKKLLQETPLHGVGLETGWKRQYPAGHLTGHVLGYVGAENKGLAGLEMKYESTLCGHSGKEVFVVDSHRRPIGIQPGVSSEVEDGENLVLTIDAVIQRYTYEALKKQVEAYEAESGVAMVMDPWTGAILAMVSLPDYEPADFSTTAQDRMRNRILTDPYEPGSIFKPIVAAVALEAGSIGYEEKFDCEDGYFARYKIGEFGNHRYGLLSTREILIHSSNVGMAKIGLKMGQKKLYDGLRLMGFSEKTGVDLPGEEPGLLRPLSKWSGWSVTRIPFGHEVSVTPLQICRAYCIFANGGYIVRPHLVRAVIDREGTILEDKQPAIKTGYVLKKDVAEWMVQKALSDVVKEGTGTDAALDNCQVWGKTGTANIAKPGGGYDTHNYVASFVGGAPAKNPQVVVLASIRKPNRSLGKGYSGGRVAAPVVHDILKPTLEYLGVTQPEQPPVESEESDTQDIEGQAL